MIAEFDTRCDEGTVPGAEVLPGAPGDFFAPARAAFAGAIAWLEGAAAAGLEHADLEQRLLIDVRELTRLGLQGHLDLRAEQEARVTVTGAEGVRRGCMEAGRRRPLLSVFGPVVVSRSAYRAKGHANLCPADAGLNLPVEQHSHGLRRVSAIEAARGSYDETLAAIERATGQVVGKRQVEQLAQRAAVDFRRLLRGPPDRRGPW